MNQTPAEWYQKQLEKLRILADTDLEPIDYLRADHGHSWLLLQFDGLRALLAHCLAAGGALVVLVSGDTSAP